jgi:hypothetical protein
MPFRFYRRKSLGYARRRGVRSAFYAARDTAPALA